MERDEITDLESQPQPQPQSVDHQPPPKAPSIFKKANRPVTLKFEDVIYKIKTKKSRCGFLNKMMRKSSPNTETKLVLDGVTGTVLPGEMLALLGPSGSGKTTLLTALSGRLGGKLKGKITYNGKPFSNKIKRNTGFVTQDDVLYAHLTVTETLVFTALLRLPNTFTKEEKVAHAEAVVTQLGLTKCKDHIIGGPLLRGVSGGERKRVSIGQEMLINPSLLFLDEPTSGLDSTTAQRIVTTLWDLANGGRTVVMTIHQPSSQLFCKFHKVLLLSDGNPLYFGKSAEVLDYFSNIGYATSSVGLNPFDFLLDLANGVYTCNESGVNKGHDAMEEDQQVAVREALVSAYKSNLANRLKEEVHDQSNNYQIPDDTNGTTSTNREEEKKYYASSGGWSTNWGQQFMVLLRRGLKERKHQAFSVLRITQIVVSAFIAGLLWWQCSNSSLQDQIGLLFFYSSFWGFYPIYQAIHTFPEERMMLMKERSSGMYRLSAWFLARSASDLPMELILPTIFVIITYWMAGFKPTPGHFFETLFVVLLSVLGSYGIGLALGALVMDVRSASTLGSVITNLFLLTGGYYVHHVPKFMSWTKYVSLYSYTYKLLLGSQFKADDTYPCDGPTSICTVGSFPAIKIVGLGQKPISYFALVFMIVFYRLIAYIRLTRIGVVTVRRGD